MSRGGRERKRSDYRTKRPGERGVGIIISVSCRWEGVELWLAESARRLARNDEVSARIGIGAKEKSKRGRRESVEKRRTDGRASERAWGGREERVCG